jgi:hypothetical protein
MLIDESSPITQQSSRSFWEDEYKNKKILSVALDKAIYALLQDDKKTYSMDTGQTTINVTKHDLPSLMNQQKEIAKQIEYLENKIGLNNQPAMFQGVPVW